MQRHWLWFAGVSVISITAIASAWGIHLTGGVMVYDANFDVFHSLPPEYQAGVMSTIALLTRALAALLMVSNLMWIGFVTMLLAPRRRAARM